MATMSRCFRSLVQPASLSAAGAGLRLLGFGGEQLPIIYSVGERRPASRRPSVAGLRDVDRKQMCLSWRSRRVATLTAMVGTPTGDAAAVWGHPDPDVRRSVAASRLTSAETLDQMVSDPDPAVRVRIAKHASTSAATLRRLVSDNHHEVLEALTRRPLEPSLVETLAGNDSEWVRAAVALRNDCPSQTISRLAADPSPLVHLGLASNPRCGSEELDVIIKDSDDRELARLVARHPRCGAVTLERLIKIADPGVRTAVLEHPNCPERFAYKSPPGSRSAHPGSGTEAEALTKAASHRRVSVRCDAATHPDTPADVLEKLGSDRSKSVLFRVAQNPNTPREVLLRLARHENRDIRESTATNPSTPADMLAELADEPEMWQSTAANPSTPPATLAQLARCDNVHIVSIVAGHPACPPDVLRTIAALGVEPPDNEAETVDTSGWDDDRYRARSAAARNPACPHDAMQKLAEDTNPLVRQSLARNTACPPDILQRLAQNPSVHVRIAIAANVSTPHQTLVELANDPDPYVRRTIAEHPLTSDEAMTQLADDAVSYVAKTAQARLPDDISGDESDPGVHAGPAAGLEASHERVHTPRRRRGRRRAVRVSGRVCVHAVHQVAPQPPFRCRGAGELRAGCREHRHVMSASLETQRSLPQRSARVLTEI